MIFVLVDSRRVRVLVCACALILWSFLHSANSDPFKVSQVSHPKMEVIKIINYILKNLARENIMLLKHHS